MIARSSPGTTGVAHPTPAPTTGCVEDAIFRHPQRGFALSLPGPKILKGPPDDRWIP
jgi:hypothetical protein